MKDRTNDPFYNTRLGDPNYRSVIVRAWTHGHITMGEARKRMALQKLVERPLGGKP